VDTEFPGDLPQSGGSVADKLAAQAGKCMQYRRRAMAFRTLLVIDNLAKEELAGC